jgi:hypothetical protein
MFPFEVDYLANKERYKDFQREAACDQLLAEAGFGSAGWSAGKVVEWLESKLGKRTEV